MRITGMFSIAICLIISSCGSGSVELPQNAKEWLKKYEAIGNESIAAAKSVKDYQRKTGISKAMDPKTDLDIREKLGRLMETKGEAIKSLNPEQQKVFADEFEKITDGIQFQISALSRS